MFSTRVRKSEMSTLPLQPYQQVRPLGWPNSASLIINCSDVYRSDPPFPRPPYHPLPSPLLPSIHGYRVTPRNCACLVCRYGVYRGVGGILVGGGTRGGAPLRSPVGGGCGGIGRRRAQGS